MYIYFWVDMCVCVCDFSLVASERVTTGEWQLGKEEEEDEECIYMFETFLG